MGKTYCITGLDHQGRGITKEDEKVIFVENALPNEEVEIEIVKNKKKYAEAIVKNYHKKSTNRIEALCPYYEKCGGCHLMHIPYEKQLEWKENKVKEILKKFGNLEIEVSPILASEQWNYRNKATFQVQNNVGYYEKGSYQVVPIEKCLIVDPKINDVLSIIKENINLNGIKQIMIRTGLQTMISFDVEKEFREKQLDKIKEYVDTIVVNDKVVYGSRVIEMKIDSYTYEVSPTAFFQVNTKQAFLLYEKAREYADFKREDHLLDLYCGTGTIGIHMSQYVDKVYGIEINQKAIEDANRNKEKNGIQNIQFECGEVGKIIHKIPSEFDVIIVDPPRSGLDSNTISYLNNSKAKKIVYVSCDPITLARDLKLLDSYTVKEVTPVDMFPNTYHVECVSLLSLKEPEK